MEYGLIGHPLGHSFSKEIHEQLKNYTYEITDIDENSFHQFMEKRNFKAINVTIPYKEKVIPYLDYIDDIAKKIGAVNTIVNKNGKLYGYNTDIFGLTELIKRNIEDISGKTVLILGTGGTSKTAEFAVKTLNCKKIYKATREIKNKDSANQEKTEYIEYNSLSLIKDDVEILINTTPVGMYPNSEKSPVDIDIFPNLKAVTDAVYNPLQTKLVYSAKKKKINAESGLFMLVSQAVKAAELFTGETIEEEKKFKVFKNILNKRRNIVLTGMPGCGKSTIGKILAESTGKSFIDTDNLITERYGHPSEIINHFGEKYFRDKETEIIDSIKAETGKIIAVGGGAVLRDENIEYLKRNGILVFIDRDISQIMPTKNRPLSSDKDKLEKLYKERYDRYLNTSDIKITSDKDIETAVSKIIKEISI